MCSVCGVATDKPGSANMSTVVEMLRATRHRGPDACGVYAAGRVHHAADPDRLAAASAGAAPAAVVLGQSRLAITGSSRAVQPLVTEDGALALAHNGEAYNHRALAALLPEGAAATGSDSEVLLRVLERHLRSTDDLRLAVHRTVSVTSGMYALAATDGRTVVLARDAIGKKPLYYVEGAGRLAWASERKALTAVAAEERAAIRRLRPGEILVREPGLPIQVEVAERLAEPAVDIVEMEAAVAAYSAALDASVARRTEGVARAAVFFSGGVDSVLVAVLLQRAGVEATGYVCGAAGSSDVEQAVAVAAELGLPIRVIDLTEEGVAKELPRILAAAELHGPMMAEVSVPMWFAARAAHDDGHRIVFTGQAADELFAGYDWYRRVVEKDGHLTLHARLWEDVRALPIDCLEREDRISMAWSLEMRAPFLDADVVRTAMRISPHLKLESAGDRLGKRVHRIAAARLGVPEAIAFRTKVPAQDGASVHALLERIARRRFPKPPDTVDVPDFGSNYRYRDAKGAYGSRRVRALLAEMVERGGFVVAGEDGSAHAPGTTPTAGVK